MLNIYEYNNMYFIKENDKYIVCDVIIKKNTIVIVKTDEYLDNLDNPTIYTYKELRDKLIIR